MAELGSSYNSELARKVELTEIILAIILVLLSIICVLNYQFLRTEINAGVSTYGLIGLFFLTFFVELVPQVLNPYLGIIVALASGINLWWVLIVASVASIAGSLAGFWLGERYGFRILEVTFERKKLEKMIAYWNKHGRIFVALSAVTPLPYLPLVFGAMKMSWKNFIIFGVVVRTIGVMASVYTGHIGLF